MHYYFRFGQYSEVDTPLSSFAFTPNRTPNYFLLFYLLVSKLTPISFYVHAGVRNHAARISVIADKSWKGGDMTMFVIDDLPWSIVKLSKPLG